MTMMKKKGLSRKLQSSNIPTNETIKEKGVPHVEETAKSHKRNINNERK